tara:strand:- start:4631 stop:5566 length:936 start_codon:yes stop_codon:yes gene_type:complete
MNYNTITPPTFSTDNNDALTFLENNGYVVFSNVLTSDSKTDFFNCFKEDMKTLSPNFNIYDSNTWIIKNYPGMFSKGMCVFNGIGQANFMWYLRTNKAIQNIYKKLYNTNDLVTSFDGCSIFCSNKQKSKSWHHIDQNPKNSIKSYQSSYNFYPVTQKSSGFVLAPESHKKFSPNVNHNKDWIMLDADNEWHDKVVKLLIPGNCLTIWNSKTIHANCGMEKKYVNSQLDRLTCYLTFLPKQLRSEQIKHKRLDGYLTGTTTSHWANKYEPKKYPYGFKKQHESKILGHIKPYFTADKPDIQNIPCNRLELI